MTAPVLGRRQAIRLVAGLPWLATGGQALATTTMQA
jgi:hypothetical protein